MNFRHKCSSRERRAAMTDDEFWDDVYPSEPFEEFDVPVSGDGIPCPECGEVGGCATDAEGRILVHVVADEDE